MYNIRQDDLDPASSETRVDAQRKMLNQYDCAARRSCRENGSRAVLGILFIDVCSINDLQLNDLQLDLQLNDLQPKSMIYNLFPYELLQEKTQSYYQLP